MGNKTVVQFVELFVKLADEHNACLATKNYNKRSRIAKKLMGMLAYIDTATNVKEIVSGILNSGSKYAVMWISNYAFKNEISQMQNINIIEEASLSSDGVIVQSTLSRVDARISSQIDELATRLINGIKDDSEQE